MSEFYQWPQERQEAALRSLATSALEQYEGGFSEPALLKYRENAIFGVQRDDGIGFVLRIHRHGYHSDAALASELAWMEALALHGVPVPDVHRCKNGDALAFAEAAGVPEKRQVDLLTWIGGEALAKLEDSGALPASERRTIYERIGALTADLHNHASTWRRPSSFTRHDWFTDALVGERPLWGRFWELDQLSEGERSLLESARARAATELALLPVTPENSGLIHADLLPDNLLIEGDALRPIDFDDAGFGWHMFDLATTLYFTLDDADHAALRASLLAGYRSVRDLTPEQEASLDLFLMVRGTTYLGWVGSRQETPTARELAPDLIARACKAAGQYLTEGRVS